MNLKVPYNNLASSPVQSRPSYFFTPPPSFVQSKDLSQFLEISVLEFKPEARKWNRPERNTINLFYEEDQTNEYIPSIRNIRTCTFETEKHGHRSFIFFCKYSTLDL